MRKEQALGQCGGQIAQGEKCILARSEDGFSDRAQLKARKDHPCRLCAGRIRKGQEYIRHTGVFCGEFYTERSHVHCDALGLAFLQSNAEGSEFGEDGIRNWITQRVCLHCDWLGGCGGSPFACRTVIERLVPETYRGAALQSLTEVRDGR